MPLSGAWLLISTARRGSMWGLNCGEIATVVCAAVAVITLVGTGVVLLVRWHRKRHARLVCRQARAFLHGAHQVFRTRVGASGMINASIQLQNDLETEAGECLESKGKGRVEGNKLHITISAEDEFFRK